MEKDYQRITAEVFSGSIPEETRKQVRAFKLEERFFILDYLLNDIVSELHSIIEIEKTLIRLTAILKQFRDEFRKNPERMNALRILDRLCREKEEEYQDAVGISPEEKKTLSSIVKHLQEYFRLVSADRSEDSFSIVKNEFDQEVREFNKKIEKTKIFVTRIIEFVQEWPKDYKELGFLIGGIASNVYSARFVSEYSPEAYFSNAEEAIDYKAVKKLVLEKDYSVNPGVSGLKEKLILQMFSEGTDPEGIRAYIQENITSVAGAIIDENNIEAVRKLLDFKEFVTKDNIRELINHAIEKEKHEIYVILLEYKNQHIGYDDADIPGKFSL